MAGSGWRSFFPPEPGAIQVEMSRRILYIEMAHPRGLETAKDSYRVYRQDSISWQARPRFSIVTGDSPGSIRVQGAIGRLD